MDIHRQLFRASVDRVFCTGSFQPQQHRFASYPRRSTPHVPSVPGFGRASVDVSGKLPGRQRAANNQCAPDQALDPASPEDGVDRGIAAFVICASLIRQFEFVQNGWANDPKFHELGNEHDPMIRAQDGTFDFIIPKRPIRRKIKGLTRLHDRKGRSLRLPSRH